MDAPPPRSSFALLALGAAAGIAAAGYGILRSSDASQLPEGAVASVNGAAISSDTYTRLVAGFESDTREAASPEMRARILDRLIEEELLVQRGLELGLAESDRRVRADIVQAMIRAAIAEAESAEPSERELRAFYEEERDVFTTPGRLRIAQLFVRVKDAAADAPARARAEQARAQLAAGGELAAVRAALGDAELSPAPDALLPPAKLREYVGPSVLRVALEAELGVWSAPVRSGAGYHVIAVVEREPASTPPLDEIRDQVRSEWVRRGGDRALRSYLDELRDDADVRVAEALPQ
ncbi:MAG TPA: peptidyl-prolyl cis-trans isomerase [Myxococcota bacterium]|nr:peptidyl-prolyl cis-trans isomerase [Myxococcota bacterium]